MGTHQQPNCSSRFTALLLYLKHAGYHPEIFRSLYAQKYHFSRLLPTENTRNSNNTSKSFSAITELPNSFHNLTTTFKTYGKHPENFLTTSNSKMQLFWVFNLRNPKTQITCPIHNGSSQNFGIGLTAL